MNRTERYKHNYRVLISKGYSAKESRQMRTWGQDRIKSLAGVNVNVATPPIKRKYQKAMPTYKRKELELMAAGLPAKQIKKLKYQRWENVKKVKADFNKMGLFFKTPTNATSREQRKQMWSGWSKQKSLPKYIIALAEYVNAKKKLDPTSRYGYNVVYESFINGIEVDIMMDTITPDRTDGDKYIEILKLPNAKQYFYVIKVNNSYIQIKRGITKYVKQKRNATTFNDYKSALIFIDVLGVDGEIERL